MATAQHTQELDDHLVAADIPTDDPATVPADEGDIGSAPAAEGVPQVTPAALPESLLVHIRSFTLRAAELALRHRDSVHYTQESVKRWEGISHKLYAHQNKFPIYADCSSFVTWCLWNGLSTHKQPDTVNGLKWTAGYTGTLLKHGVQVAESKIVPCDLALYGNGWPGEHVAICIGGGLVISHGGEEGPLKIPLHYRKDLMEIRRYIH